MRARLVLAVTALLAVPACFDPIVGTQCATGYSPCGGRCVAAGTCGVDAGEQADSAQIVISDSSLGEPETAADAEAAETNPAVDAPQIEDSVSLEDAPALVGLDAAAVVNVDPDASLPAADVDNSPLPSDTGVLLVGDDASTVDAPIFDAALVCVSCLDALDAVAEGAGVGDDGAAGPEADVGWDDAGPLQCADPLVICDNECVDLTSDYENCGSCNNICTSSVCLAGTCLVCSSEETVCGQQCINTASDPDNCGGCFSPCSSGLCSNSLCEASGTGRVIVIGHDYLKNRPAMNRILGNAVFLWPVNPVRLLTYQGAANPTAIAGAIAAIAQVAAATGRQVQRTDVSAADVPAHLAATDVFLIYGQEQASDATLTQLGQDWASAMTAFINLGGTVIVLDALYAGNAGGVQILSQAALFDIQHDVSTTNAVCTVVSPGDALASGLPKTYRCEQNSVSFTTSEVGPAVTSVVASGAPVVVDKVFF
jgi:Stigma-specific protein, Stig1